MGSTLIERVMETGLLLIRKLGGDRADEIAIYRFLSASSVTTVEIVETEACRTAADCADQEINPHANNLFATGAAMRLMNFLRISTLSCIILTICSFTCKISLRLVTISSQDIRW